MAVQRGRLSNQRKNIRRSHHAKKPRSLGTCANCSAKKMPHCICPSCGSYAGRVITAGREATEE